MAWPQRLVEVMFAFGLLYSLDAPGYMIQTDDDVAA